MTDIKRVELIVWLKHLKQIQLLNRFGLVHYVSRKMNYAVVYVNHDKANDMIRKLNHLNFVERVDWSPKHELKTEYPSSAKFEEEGVV
jgi:uncharacterized protein YlbG (UPF0298 family)